MLHLALLIVVATFIPDNYLPITMISLVCHNCSPRLPASRCKMKCRMTAWQAIDFAGSSGSPIDKRAKMG